MPISTIRCSFNPSVHAKDQMIERGISKEEMLETILQGAKRIQGEKIISSFKKMEAVYKQEPCHYFIITIYPKTSGNL